MHLAGEEGVGEGGGLHLKQHEFLSLKDALCLVEIGQVHLEKCQSIFAISHLSLLGTGQGPSFEQT